MKYVLITGASRGLGKELAYTFASKGYGIVLNYLNHEKEAKLVEQDIQTTYQVPVCLLKGDVSDPCQVKEMFDIVVCKGLDVEVMILNAGIDIPSEVQEKTYDSFMKILQVNLVGNFLMTQTFGLWMEERQKGCIIYINSDNAIDQNDCVTLEYDVSKAGLLMLAKDYAQFFQYVKVHTVAPGFMDTDMNTFPKDIKDQLPFISLKTVCQKVYEQVLIEESGNVVVVR